MANLHAYDNTDILKNHQERKLFMHPKEQNHVCICHQCQELYEAPKEIILCKACTLEMWQEFLHDPEHFDPEEYYAMKAQ